MGLHEQKEGCRTARADTLFAYCRSDRINVVAGCFINGMPASFVSVLTFGTSTGGFYLTNEKRLSRKRIP